MLAKHGDTDLSEALETIQSSQDEPRAMVWSLIAGILGNARMLTEGNEDAERTLKQLTADLASKNFQNLGWNYDSNEDSNSTHLRTITLGLMGSSETKEVIDRALKMYRETDESEQLPAESRTMILSIAAKFGTEQEFEELLAKYKSAKTADYKVDLCSALTSTKNPERIAGLLEMMLDTTIVRSQDLRHWFVYLLRNRHGRMLTWEWLVNNWSWILEHFGGSKSYDDFARYSASFFSTDEMLKKYTEFFNSKLEDPALKRAILIGTEEITARAAWRKRDEEKVAKWLTKYSAKNS
jgi:aminopeptidase N